ncbi:MAG TPA: WYL domain-containing protein [Salinimicrobium sp.]|nr:WYL domain-containing protein [Salinimicrobium sp.]
MSKRESILRQNLVISKLKRTPLNFQGIMDFLEREEEISGDRYTFSQRTFQRDIQEIKEIYEIEISFDRSAGVYRVVSDGMETQNERALESFEIFNALQRSKSVSGKFILEKRKPLGTEHFHGLLHAINNHFEVIFNYEKFYDDDSKIRTVRPVAIKEARNRWYLLAEESGTVKSFGLDRIKNLQITQNKFEPLDNYNPEEDYKHSFGIINAVEKKPQKILLSFTPQQAKFIHSLPLHHSQQLIFENEKECHFEFYLYPTYDFIMEILSYGEAVKVMEPKSLQKEVKRKLEKALERYK